MGEEVDREIDKGNKNGRNWDRGLSKGIKLRRRDNIGKEVNVGDR